MNGYNFTMKQTQNEKLINFRAIFIHMYKELYLLSIGSGFPPIINPQVFSYFNSDGAHVANKKSKGEEQATSNIYSSFFLALSTTLADRFLLPEPSPSATSHGKLTAHTP
jgi:hypothetical protein